MLNKSIIKNVPLKDKNWFKTGGAAAFYSEPQTVEQFSNALQYARDNRLPLFILGEGANILISDQGFNGLVIKPMLNGITHTIKGTEAFVTAQAGVHMSQLIEYCFNNNCIGLEEFSGIPGTIGGSVYINLHYFQFLLSHFLVQATVIEKSTGNSFVVDNAWFKFGYNYSTLFHEDYFLVDATFKVTVVSECQRSYAQGRSVEIIRHRTARYPVSNTCGSFFRNFLPSEVTLESNNKKMIYVAYYLDKIGVKGALQQGGACVSYQHANMLITNQKATSQDVIQLARTMQNSVYNQFNIIPQPECRLVGFNEYPLL